MSQALLYWQSLTELKALITSVLIKNIYIIIFLIKLRTFIA